MGLLDFLNTPQGQAVASGLATYAATARRNTPINNIGRGAMGAVAGYGDALKTAREAQAQEQKDAYNKRQQELLEMHYGTEKLRAGNEYQRIMQQADKDKTDEEVAKSMWASMFQGSGYDPATLKPIKVSNRQAIPLTQSQRSTFSDMLPTDNMAPENVYVAPPEQPNPIDAMFDELGYSPGRRKYMKAWLEAKPDKAIPFLERAYVDNQKRMKASDGLTNHMVGEDGKLYGYDKATNTMKLINGEFKPKEKGPLVQNQVSYGAPVAGVDASGNAVFFQPSKDGVTPPSIVPGVMPKQPEAYSKQTAGITNVIAAAKAYREEVKNASTMKLADPDYRMKMGTLYNNMMLQAKEAYNLGVLNGPDYEILTKTLTDPTSASYNNLFSSNESKTAQVDAYIKRMESLQKGIDTSYGNRGSGKDKPGKTGVTITAPNGKTYTFPDQQAADKFRRQAGF